MRRVKEVCVLGVSRTFDIQDVLLSLSSLQDPAADQSGRREPRLSPSQSGLSSVSPYPPNLSPHPAAFPRTDDVTDCCDHCFHGNAHHCFGLHFRQLSLLLFLERPPSLIEEGGAETLEGLGSQRGS